MTDNYTVSGPHFAGDGDPVHDATRKALRATRDIYESAGLCPHDMMSLAAAIIGCVADNQAELDQLLRWVRRAASETYTSIHAQEIV